MPPRSLSVLSDDTPPLSPTSTSATRSSVASSTSSISLSGVGDLGARMSQARIGSRDEHEPTDPQGTSRKFAHESAKFSGVKEDDIQEEMDGVIEHDKPSEDRGRPGYEGYEDHAKPSRPRPPAMPRQGSYSKRHSSFDTPREVPFPYGYLASETKVPASSKEAQQERPNSVPLSPPADSNQRLTHEMDNGGDSSVFTHSTDGSTCSGSPPPGRRPHFERSSTSSLPLPTSTPYSTLPPLLSSSPPLPIETRSPPTIPTTSLKPTGSSLKSPIVSPPRVSSLKPPISKQALESNSSSPPRPNQLERMPSPPFLADEPDANYFAQPNMSQPTSLYPPARQDSRPHHSLPPPTKPMSSHAFSTSPSMRPTSLPQPINITPPGSQSTFPPPEPPTILTPPPPLSDADGKPREPAPYEPFLPRDQPPPDHTYIAVETVPTEYRLIVRLPGFQRDSITLAMRRRRILHVVADNWSDGGGHFERRISFGYDADLASVRAEFDGEILRIIVPRREPPGWYVPSQTN